MEMESGSGILTFLARDCAHNTDSCSSILVARDTTVPLIACPPDMALPAGESPCIVEVVLPAPVIELDDCEMINPGSVTVYYSSMGSTEIA